jgi:pyruvate-formate lyase-activating enzyme
VKGALPEYKGWNAAMVHEESAKIVEDMMMPKAMKEQHHMIVDGVGNTAAKMLKIAKELKDENYEIHLVHVTIPTEKTVNRAWDRFAKSAFRDSHEGPGRYVPVDYVAKNVDQRPTETYKALKESGLVDTWSSYSNDVPRGTKPLPLDRGDKNAKRR